MRARAPSRARLFLAVELAFYGAAIFIADWFLTGGPHG